MVLLSLDDAETCISLANRIPVKFQKDMFKKSFKDFLKSTRFHYPLHLIPKSTEINLGSCNFPNCKKRTRKDSYFCTLYEHCYFALVHSLPLKESQKEGITKPTESAESAEHVYSRTTNCTCIYENDDGSLCEKPALHVDKDNSDFYFCDEHVSVTESDITNARFCKNPIESRQSLKKLLHLDNSVQNAIIRYTTCGDNKDELHNLIAQRHCAALSCGRNSSNELWSLYKELELI